MTAKTDIVATAVAAGKFNTLAAALEAAELIETLQGDGPFTVFAPLDEAFAKLPSGTVETLLQPENQDQLRDVLLYHVVAGQTLMAADVVNADEAETAQGEAIAIAIEDGKVILNGSVAVVKTDIKATNGVIHVLDGVLLPSGDESEGDGM
ncbi:MAG: fasciclin domain-containing protein [Planctomycetota bacterium]